MCAPQIHKNKRVIANITVHLPMGITRIFVFIYYAYFLCKFCSLDCRRFL